MKLYFNQLTSALNDSLAPIYLIAGDEPLQRMEAADLVRKKAQAMGYADRRLFFVEQNFDWSAIGAVTNNLSLFAEKQLIEVIIFTEKLKKDGKDFLQAYLKEPAEDTVLVLRANKVDAREVWVKKISEMGVLVQVYAKDSQSLLAWLRERMLRLGMKMENQVVELIADRTEGNMLAAAQEVEKLKLLYTNQVIRLEDAEQAISDNSKYNVYDLATAAGMGDADKALRMLRGLKEEGCAPNLVLWSLTNQVRKLAIMETSLSQGESLDAVLRKEWRNRQAALRKALLRKPKTGWQRLLYWCGEVDKAVKGLSGDDVWHQLLGLTMRISGVRVLTEKKLARKA